MLAISLVYGNPCVNVDWSPAAWASLVYVETFDMISQQLAAYTAFMRIGTADLVHHDFLWKTFKFSGSWFKKNDSSIVRYSNSPSALLRNSSVNAGAPSACSVP